jgi:PAS domain S-box-containing protein
MKRFITLSFSSYVSMSITPFDLILFGVPAFVSAGVALFAWPYRSNPGGTPLIINGVGSAIWILSYGAGTRLNSQLIAPGMLGVSWLAAVLVAFSGMYVAVEYTGRKWLKRPAILAGIGGYLCLEALLIGLNPRNLFYTQVPTVVQTGTPVYEFGVWWTVHLIVTFAAAAAMLGMFLESYLSGSGVYRQQARAVLAGVAISYIAVIIEVAGLEPYPDLLYNATMAGDMVLSVTFLWALFYADFLKLTPIARKTLLEHIEDPIVVLEDENRLVYFNQAAEDLFGIGSQSAGVPVDDLSEVNGNESPDSFANIANGETEITLTPDGEERYFSLSASPVGDSQRGRVFIFRETTKEREYRLRIEAQRDNLETLNGVLRHDIRNDLQVIRGYADLLGEKSETRDEQQYIHTIKKSADHAIELTQTARELSDAMLSANVEQGRVDLQLVLEDEVKEVQSSYPDATLKFGTSIPTVTLIANEMISSVFRNLLKNAIQHNDKDTAEVTISITEYDDTVTVNIADNGPGVPDGQKETVFGKGEQGLDSSGTGMGLYLVDTLVSAHNGEVWIDDNEPEGAIFSVELPTQL